MIITKKDIGKTVYLVPTGNNLARYDGAGDAWDQVEVATITEMARTRGKMMINRKDRDYEKSFTVREFDNHQITDGMNRGFKVFATLQEVKDDKIAHEVGVYLRQNVKDIPTDKLVKIGEILELDFK